MPPHGLPVQNALYTGSVIRRIEALFSQSADPPLMERAGLAVAELARELAGTGEILVVAGPGNNGGDALVAARHLKNGWFPVTMVMIGDPHRLSTDASAALAAWRAQGGVLETAIPSGRHWSLVLDGLLGMGLARPVTGRMEEWIGAINRTQAPVLALDVPSGLSADTGQVLGCAVRAHHTVTFIAHKPGLFTLDGPDHCGTVHLRDLGLTPVQLPPPSGWLLGTSLLAEAFPARRQNSHKGLFGSVGIVGGAPGMVGAAFLAGRAALRLGAGRVHVGLLAPALWDPVQPELMVRSAADTLALDQLTALVLGPGLGHSPEALTILQAGIARPVPLLLDADALNLLASHPQLQQPLARRQAPLLLTPHPAEAARLLNSSTADVQADRIAAALTLASRYRAQVVLKGVGSICATPEGRWYLNPTGNPGMASAGTGDVLSGMAGALLAQGLDAETALLAAIYLHGLAADRLAAQGIGPVGLAASELCDAARSLVNQSFR